MSPGRRTTTGPARHAVLYCLAAGSCDLLTGVLLVAVPATVLRWMGAPLSAAAVAAGTPVFVRLVGAFVAAVGVSYLYPLALGSTRSPSPPGSADPTRRLRTVIEVTALVRTSVALVVAGAVAADALPTPWLTVTAVDGALAGTQLWMLGKGWLGRA